MNINNANTLSWQAQKVTSGNASDEEGWKGKNGAKDALREWLKVKSEVSSSFSLSLSLARFDSFSLFLSISYSMCPAKSPPSLAVILTHAESLSVTNHFLCTHTPSCTHG